jgi:hypothetical protein
MECEACALLDACRVEGRPESTESQPQRAHLRPLAARL